MWFPRRSPPNDDRLRRFRDEALAASRLSYPNIIHVYDIGEQEGTRFGAIELIEDQTFESLVASGRALP